MFCIFALQALVHRVHAAQAVGQLRREQAGLQPPAPVAVAERAGRVHAGLRAEAEIVLQLGDERVSHAGKAAAQDAPRVALLLRQAEVFRGIGTRGLRRLRQPLGKRFVVVRAAVADAVADIAVGEVVARLAVSALISPLRAPV